MKLQHQKDLAIAIAAILAIAVILAISGHKEKPQLSCTTLHIRRSSIELYLFKTTHSPFYVQLFIVQSFDVQAFDVQSFEAKFFDVQSFNIQSGSQCKEIKYFREMI
jgi:hypothetical protein